MTTAARQQTRDAWDAIAAGYDTYVTPTHLWIAGEALDRAGLQADMDFLDVACGSGSLSIPAARRGARVVAADLSPRMLERLSERARREGVAELVDCRVMDGHALELDDESVDLAGSQFGVMVFPDMPRGIAELARVTKPGGKVLVVAYGPPERVGFFALFAAALRTIVPGFGGPQDPPPLPFQLRDPERLRRELSTAGLTGIQVDTTTERLEFGSAEETWLWLVNSNPVVGAIFAELGLNAEQQAEVQGALDAQIRERFGAGPITLDCEVHIAVGTK